MTTVADLLAWLEDFAPSRLAESWDNVGLLFGDPKAEIQKVMTCLTVTSRLADEAIAEGAQAIVSHHPVLFKPTKTLRADRPETAFLWKLARAGVAHDTCCCIFPPARTRSCCACLARPRVRRRACLCGF